MSKAGKSLVEAAKQAVAISRGEADPSTFRVHVPDGMGGLRLVEDPEEKLAVVRGDAQPARHRTGPEAADAKALPPSGKSTKQRQ
jgi:hypothetical protein